MMFMRKNILIERDKFGRFVTGITPWNKGIGLNKKCETCNKEFYISLSRFQDKRGKFCSVKCRRNSFLKKSKNYILNNDIAELVGVIIGDGCIAKNGLKRKDYKIFISGNPIEDKIYMKKYLPHLIKKCLNKRYKSRLASNGALIINFQNEAFRLFLKKLGIKERKAKNVKIPKQILKNKSLLARCIRGIADTDFTLIFTKKHTNRNIYPRITGQFASFRLVKDLEKALRGMGFTLNTRYNMKRQDKRGFSWTINQVNLEGPNNLKRWLKLIGFSNQRILTRYKVWKKYGYLNPKTTLPQRLELLRGGGGVQWAKQ